MLKFYRVDYATEERKQTPGRAVYPGERIKKMEYIAKLRLNDRKYIAVLEGALAIVTENEKGEPIRWAIFNRPEAYAIMQAESIETMIDRMEEWRNK